MRQRHWLLRLMALRAVINNTQLYELREGEPLGIPLAADSVTLTVTNGFHASSPVQLPFEAGSTYFFQVAAIINNAGVAITAIMTMLLFTLYAVNGSVFLLVAANLPILTFVWVFFLQPRKAIVLKPWQPKVALSAP